MQNSDGSLAVSVPDSILDYFKHEIKMSIQTVNGSIQMKDSRSISIGTVNGYNSATLCEMKDEMLFEADIMTEIQQAILVLFYIVMRNVKMDTI
jgi:hypothetical protein